MNNSNRIEKNFFNLARYISQKTEKLSGYNEPYPVNTLYSISEKMISIGQPYSKVKSILDFTKNELLVILYYARQMKRGI